MTVLESLHNCSRTLGILVDPEKLDVDGFSAFAKAMSSSIPYFTEKLMLDQVIFLLGGSTMEGVGLDSWLAEFRKTTLLKLVLFPGSHQQLSEQADALLFLNLISGRNPQYLIGEQVKAASLLKNTNLEVIPTGYILIDGGVETAVARMSQSVPIPQDDKESILNTAIAGKLMGNQLIYLEAGSGAVNPVSFHIVTQVVEAAQLPIIVGGGLRKLKDIDNVFNAGAKMVVVGTAIEQDLNWNG
jgi:putative glycerol-1-phosphate prenyltransferase